MDCSNTYIGDICSHCNTHSKYHYTNVTNNFDYKSYRLHEEICVECYNTIF